MSVTAAVEAGQAGQRGGQGQSERLDDGDGDGERNTRAEEDAGQYVAAEGICAEPVMARLGASIRAEIE